MKENCNIIHIKNDPITNRMTAPENKLHRPLINYLYVILFVMSSLFLVIVLSFASANLIERTQKSAFIANESTSICFFKFLFFYCILLVLTTLKLSSIFFIRLYQRYAKSEIRLKCCLEPSCSEYGILAIKKYGMVIGLFKIIMRLKRCKPPRRVDYP